MPASLSPAEAAAWRYLRVLVVDDVDAMRMVMGALLGQLGIREVREAADGASALDLLEREPIHLVLCDWRMPGMDGLALLQALRAKAQHRGLPFVMASADVDPSRTNLAIEAGAQAVLTKPYDVPTLANTLRTALLGTAMAMNPPLPDLRSPLAAALGLLEAVIDDPATAAEQREQLQSAEESLLGLLDALHLATVLPQIEQRRYELRTRGVPLRKLLERALRLTGAAQAHRELQLSLDVPGPLRGQGTLLASGDSLLCHTLFMLLLRQACNTAPSGGQIVVRVDGSATDTVQISIQSDGAWPAEARQRFLVPVPGEAGNGEGYAALRLAQAQRGKLQVLEHQGAALMQLQLLRSQLTLAGG